MGKVPQYTQDAINTYRAKFDIIQINFSKGTKERIKALGVPISKYVNELVQADLQRLENATQAPQTDEKKTVEQIPKEEPKEEPPKEIKWLTKEELAALPKPRLLDGIPARPFQKQENGAIMWEGRDGTIYDEDGYEPLPFD